jgi:hypothetical protein
MHILQVEQNSADYAQLHDNLQNMQMQNLHLQEIAQNLVRFANVGMQCSFGSRQN